MRANKRNKPTNIVVLRDGLCEGQYRMAVDVELQSIKNALGKFYSAGRPAKYVHVMLSQKHNTRHFIKTNDVFSLQPGSFIDDGARKDLVQLHCSSSCNIKMSTKVAKVAQNNEKWIEVMQNMRSLAETRKMLKSDERELLSLAFKNVVEFHRSSWRVISSIEQKTEGSEKKQQMAKESREMVENELRIFCEDLIDLLDNILIPSDVYHESEVLYLKTKGDCYYHLAEVLTGADRSAVVDKSQHFYEEAYKSSKTSMNVLTPSHLGLALNFSVFYYEIKQDPAKAYELAKQAFDDAMAKLSTLNRDSYKDSTRILQLLEKYVKLWALDTAADDQDVGGQMGETGGN
uniref:Piwi domain-containing protein n=1 Tax=Panagrolaimus sp. JU765 TaxID=591449 RepID=A0AC34RLG4_9BILA